MADFKESLTKQAVSGEYTHSSSSPKTITFDDVLEHHIGGIGVYQISLFFILGLVGFSTVDPMFLNFVGYSQDHWCRIEELSHLPPDMQKLIAIPTKGYNREWKPVYESCLYYKYNYSALSQEDITSWNTSSLLLNGTDTARCDNGWNYDTSLIRSSIVNRWDLVCGKDALVQLVSTISIAGFMVGSLAVGPFSDRFGRKIGLLVFVSIKALAGFASSLAPNYVVFAIAQLLVSTGGIALYVISFSLSATPAYSHLHAFIYRMLQLLGIHWTYVMILVLELMAPAYRTAAGMCLATIYSLGFMAVALFAYFIRVYYYLLLVPTVSACIILVSLWFVPESPRWLILNRRYEEAEKICQKIASVNKRSLPKDFDMRSVSTGSSETVTRATMIDVFKSSVLRKRCAVIGMHWFTDSLIFYALSLNAASLSGNIFFNTFLLGAVEVPANLSAILLMNWKRLGRRGTACASLLLAGIVCLLCVPLIITNSSPTAVTVLSLFGKAGATMGWNCMFVYTAELYPTEVRNVGLGLASFAARVSGMAAPFVGGPLGDIWAPMPNIIFGGFSLVAASLCLLLPETFGTDLPDTISAAEKADRDRKAKNKEYNISSSLSNSERGASTKNRVIGYTNEITKF